MPDDELRCPSCGALVSAEAEWCGQCFSPLRATPEPEPAAPSPAVQARIGSTAASPEAPARSREPFWPCSVCGAENPIALDICTVCGTPFAHVMRTPAEASHVEPRDAVVRSLIFPGLGHRDLGRNVDGFARGVLFAVTFGMGLLLALVASGSAALVGAFILFLIAGIGVYVMCAIEAHRLATGGDLLIPTHILLWILAGVVVVGITLLVVGAVSATHR